MASSSAAMPLLRIAEPASTGTPRPASVPRRIAARKAVAPIQFEDGAEVHVGLPRTGLHLHGEVPALQRFRGAQAVAELHLAEVLEDLVVEEAEAVTDSEVGLGEGEDSLGTG